MVGGAAAAALVCAFVARPNLEQPADGAAAAPVPHPAAAAAATTSSPAVAGERATCVAVTGQPAPSSGTALAAEMDELERRIAMLEGAPHDKGAPQRFPVTARAGPLTKAPAGKKVVKGNQALAVDKASPPAKSAGGTRCTARSYCPRWRLTIRQRSSISATAGTCSRFSRLVWRGVSWEVAL